MHKTVSFLMGNDLVGSSSKLEIDFLKFLLFFNTYTRYFWCTSKMTFFVVFRENINPFKYLIRSFNKVRNALEYIRGQQNYSAHSLTLKFPIFQFNVFFSKSLLLQIFKMTQDSEKVKNAVPFWPFHRSSVLLI